MAMNIIIRPRFGRVLGKCPRRFDGALAIDRSIHPSIHLSSFRRVQPAGNSFRRGRTATSSCLISSYVSFYILSQRERERRHPSFNFGDSICVLQQRNSVSEVFLRANCRYSVYMCMCTLLYTLQDIYLSME